MKFNFDVLEKCRIRKGRYGSNPGDMFGAFEIPFTSMTLRVLATDGAGLDPQWEHVSVSLPNRCPNWGEMSYVKSLFWNDDETVIQFHPRKTDYVNQHNNCLHLWKQFGKEIELPPKVFV